VKIEAAFRPLAELERKLADLYAFWAEAFVDDREATFVFLKMSSEEMGHVAFIEYARRFVQKDPKLGGEVDVDLSDVQGAIERVRGHRESGVAPSLERAVAIAQELEASAADSHARAALKQVNPELERLLQYLGGEDEQHLGRLTEFAAKRGLSRTGR
jgi:rubrerythrin